MNGSRTTRTAVAVAVGALIAGAVMTAATGLAGDYASPYARAGAGLLAGSVLFFVICDAVCVRKGRLGTRNYLFYTVAILLATAILVETWAGPRTRCFITTAAIAIGTAFAYVIYDASRCRG